jgi:hypothetical protein
MTLLLLRKYWGVGLAVILAGWVMLACHQRDQAIEQRGRAIERAMELDRQLASLATKHRADSARADLLERVVQHDTTTLTRWLTSYDTARIAFNVHDTVAVIRYVATADSTIKACKEAVSSLALSCAAKDTVITDLRQTIATLRSATTVPAKDRRFSLGVTAGWGATYAGGSFHTGPSMSVGGSLRLY